MLGDVILFYDRKGNAMNIAGQRVFHRDRLPIATHAALFCGNYTITHALPDGIEETLFFEVMEPDANYRVVRYEPLQTLLEQDTAKRGSFQLAVVQCTANQYNYGFKWKGRKHKHFCSELVAVVFKEMGFDLPGDPHKVLPTDIDRISRKGGGWRDVTDEVREELTSLNCYGMYYDFVDAPKGHAEAKRYLLEHRLVFHGAVLNEEKRKTAKKVFGMTESRDYFSSGRLWTELKDIQNHAAKMDRIFGVFFRAFAEMMVRDQGIYYFFKDLELPGRLPKMKG